MLRTNNGRTRSQILGLNKRNGPRKSENSPHGNSGERPMTPTTTTTTPKRAAMSTPSRPNRMAPPQTTNTEGFSQQEIMQLKQCFDLFDVEGTGSIAVESLRSVLESMLEMEEQSYPHLDEILRILSSRPDTEMLDFDDYVSLMASTSLQQRLLSNNNDDDAENDQPNFQHVFDLFDIDHKGYITAEDLHRVALELGEHDMTMDELQEMIERARSKKTGQVTLKEFSKIMTLNLFQKMEDRNADD